MIYEYWVYLIKSENRLVIVGKPIYDENYQRLMSTDGEDHKIVLTSCKLFCLGYLYGSRYDKSIVNSLYEFQ